MTAAAEHDTDPVTVAELAVLGSVTRSPESAAEAIAAGLAARHFRHPHHAQVYAAVLRLAGMADPVVEPAAVIAELGGVLDGDGRPGGAAFVRSLAPHAGPAGHHARRVMDAWQQRNVRATLAAAADLADAAQWDAAADPAKIRDLIDAATEPAGLSALADPLLLLQEAVDALERGADPALSTGYPELDEVTGGLVPQTVTVIAARTSGGKTLLGGCMAEHVATELEAPVLFSSLEMRARQLNFRRISAAARVSLKRLTRYQPDDADWAKISNAYGNLASSRLRIDDTPAQSMAYIDARLADLARAGDPAAAHFLDYVQIATPPDRRVTREQQVSAMSRDYAEIVKRHNVAGVMLAQLNRGPEHRKDGRPLLSDLRESGSLEQDADVVILLHRDGEDLWAIVAKNRQGPTGEVKLNWQGHFGRIGSNVVPWTPHKVVD